MTGQLHRFIAFAPSLVAVVPTIVLTFLLTSLPFAPAEAQKKASHHARMTQKTMGPLGLEVEFAAEPVPGQPVAIFLHVSSPVALSDVNVALDPDDSLVLLAPARQVAVGPIEAREIETLTIEVLPIEPGRHYLRVFVTAYSVRGAVARPLVIPVVLATTENAGPDDSPESSAASRQVDAKRPRIGLPQPPHAEPANASDRGAVSSMPAWETIRP